MLSEWLVSKLSNHKAKLIILSGIFAIPFAFFSGVLSDWVVAAFLILGMFALTLGIIVPSNVSVVVGSKDANRSDFNHLLSSFTPHFMYDLDYDHADFISNDTVSKYKALPKEPAESIAQIYSDNLTLIKASRFNRLGRLSDLESKFIGELERSIDIQYKYHVEQNLQDEIKALQNMNNHYADMLVDTDKEPK